MEALQMLKFALKKDRLSFTRGWITSETVMSDEELAEDVDLLALLLKDDGDHEDVLDTIIQDVDEDNLHN